MDWIKHEALNMAYFCRKLYGESNPATLSKFHKKARGEYGTAGKGFSRDEQLKLKAIFKELKKDIPVR